MNFSLRHVNILVFKYFNLNVKCVLGHKTFERVEIYFIRFILHILY